MSSPITCEIAITICEEASRNRARDFLGSDEVKLVDDK